MTIRRHIRRWHGPTLFALIGLCFSLPFGTVDSCSTNATTTVIGMQLVTHSVPQGGAMHETRRSEDVSVWVEHHASLPATVAFAVAVLGLALGLFGIARGPGWCAAGVLFALLWLFYRFANWGVDDRWGYDLALLLAVCATLVHARRAWRRRRGFLDRQLASAAEEVRNGHPRRAPCRLQRARFDLGRRPDSAELERLSRLAIRAAAGAEGGVAARAERFAADLVVTPTPPHFEHIDEARKPRGKNDVL